MLTRDRVRILDSLIRIKDIITHIDHLDEKETVYIEKYLYEIEKLIEEKGE